MAEHSDTVLLEHARIERARLGAALLSGRLGERRAVRDHARSTVATIVVAALACAVCVGVSFLRPLVVEGAPGMFPISPAGGAP